MPLMSHNANICSDQQMLVAKGLCDYTLTALKVKLKLKESSCIIKKIQNTIKPWALHLLSPKMALRWGADLTLTTQQNFKKGPLEYSCKQSSIYIQFYLP